MPDLLPTIVRLRDAMREADNRSCGHVLMSQETADMAAFMLDNIDAIIDALTPQPPADSWSPPPLKPDGTVEASAEPGELPAPEWGPPADLAETVAELEFSRRQYLVSKAECDGAYGGGGSIVRNRAAVWESTFAGMAAERLPSLLAALKRRSEDAEMGELLRRVEERWSETEWHIEISRNVDAGWYVSVSDSNADGYEVGTGDTFAVALRQLLGGSNE